MAARGKPPRSPAAAGSKAPRQPALRAGKTAASRESKAVRDGAAPAGADFPIVGIGCSAGGLEALEAFLGHVPVASGIAFVVIQHLDPVHESALAELLQRVTPMSVVQAGDCMAVKPDCVYVIPPNKDLSLLHGVLHLLEPIDRRGLRLPVDFFLRTLAEDRLDRAIGVILSGMGSDGVLGMRAIKERSGLTLAQEPATAKAASMPRSVIDAGLADIVAPPELLPARIVDYLRRAPHSLPAEASDDGALQKIVILLRARSGNDFSLYKPSTLSRRIERRIALHQLGGLDEYVSYLRENQHELDLLFKELLIGVTNFFRDPAVWELLRTEIIPGLLASHADERTLRAWVPACSSGEEAYSLAMVFKEAVEAVKPGERCTLQIYATDLDRDAIAKARKGVYPKNIAADVSPERLARFFASEESGYRVSREIRDMVIFAPQNIVSDPPFTKLDILSCRNLMIYFRQELQKKLLPLFHYALNHDGVLILGSAETVGAASHLFAAAAGKAHIFRRIDSAVPLPPVEYPLRLPIRSVSSAGEAHPDRIEDLGRLTDHLIQQTYAPAAVLVNGDGDILYISGRTGKYLEPAAGKVNVNIHAMARAGLREALTGMIAKALRQAQPIHLDGLQVDAGDGNKQIVNVTVQGIETPEALRGRALIVFSDVAAPPPGGGTRKTVASAKLDALRQELLQTQNALRATYEERQTALEEIKSANEELQSTNEEQQSTNEELTTSKEEMQSMNEELQTVNAELQSKVEDLTRERSDMANLLNSTEIATIFLDGKMRLRRFTSHATKLYKLLPGDVGRPLSDIVTAIDYPQLIDDAREVLRSMVFCEKQVNTNDRRWYRVRIMPYRTQDNVIDGIVVTFIDITEIKKLEAELRKHGVPAAAGPLP